MTLHSKNISYDNVVTIEETCVYRPNEINPDHTDLRQTALVHAYPYGVSNRIEKFLTGKFVTNAPLGRVIMERTVKNVEYEARMKDILAHLKRETALHADAFEQRFDTFREDLNNKVKETEEELSQFYQKCKRAGEQWTSERLEEVENFLEEQFEELFPATPTTVLQKC